VFSGSIREGRNSITVARWALDVLSSRNDADFGLIDLAEHEILPLTDPVPPSARHGKYNNPQARDWARVIGGYDGFIFATPEYNAGIPGTMKNAFDTVFDEWSHKPVGFIGWGGDGARTSIRHWHDVVTRAAMLPVGADLHLPFREVFPGHTFTPQEQHNEAVAVIADAVVAAAGPTS
jgi:NAD(P)H-dependent FMN reductase